MLRALVVVSLTVAFLVGGCSSGPKPLTKTQSYVWGVEYIGNSSTFVCKQVEVVIFRDRRIPNSVESQIVDERHCAKMAKPSTISSVNPPS